MSNLLLILIIALIHPSIAFLSASRPSTYPRADLLLLNARGKKKRKVTNNKPVVGYNKDDDSTTAATTTKTAPDFSDLPRTLDPTEFQMTLDPSSAAGFGAANTAVDKNNFQPPASIDAVPNTIDPASGSREQQPALIETIGGGTSMIFEMARRMLVWDENETKDAAAAAAKPKAPPSPGVLPRWHPHSGISDVNPSFRTSAPIMNNQGYASTIWRNVRKRNKPSLWRHALRTYDRMEAAASDSKTSVLRIERTTIHHEGALLACAKLGLWKEALEIYANVEKDSIGFPVSRNGRKGEGVTDSMVFSLVKACVRSCKKMPADKTPLEERRVPIDAAVDVVKKVHSHHFPVVARHLNPLAAAYQSIGLLEEAKALLDENLSDRSIGPEPEYGDESFNVHDVSAKDKASYALLVKGAIASGSWTNAVQNLRNMTEAGLYPTNSHLNSWTEVSERKTRRRTTRSWKKKRDEYWLESVQ